MKVISKTHAVAAAAVATCVSLLAGHAEYKVTSSINEGFKRENGHIAKYVYEIAKWHLQELPAYRGMSDEQLVVALLSTYDSANDLKALVERVAQLRKPESEVSSRMTVNIEDTIRLEPDLPPPSEQEKLTKAEKEYYAGIQALKPLVWSFQRRPISEAIRAGTKAWFAAILAYFALVVAVSLVLVPFASAFWRFSMRRLSDLSKAIQGRFLL